MKYFVSVIIPTYYDWSCLDRCLNALNNQTYSEDLFEVIIVNNAVGDTPPKLYSSKNYSIITEKKVGSYAARNTGIKEAKGEILAFTDSDCIPDEKWIENAVELLKSGAERIAGKVKVFSEASEPTTVEKYEMVFAFDQERYADNGKSVTANMITWKKHFDTVGLFDDSLESGGDFEWGKRANKIGLPIIYSDKVIVKHPARKSFKEMEKKIRRVIKGGIKRRKYDDGLLKILIFGYLPPFRSVKKVINYDAFTITEKIKVIFLSYYFKSFVTTYKIRLKIHD